MSADRMQVTCQHDITLYEVCTCATKQKGDLIVNVTDGLCFESCISAWAQAYCKVAGSLCLLHHAWPTST